MTATFAVPVPEQTVPAPIYKTPTTTDEVKPGRYEAIYADIDELLIEEVEALEELAGLPVDVLFAEGRPKGRAFRFYATIVKRRHYPDFTVEEAGKVPVRFGSMPKPGPTVASA